MSSQALAVVSEKDIQPFKEILNQQWDAITALMPRTIEQDQFKSLAIQLFYRQPELAKAEPMSFYVALAECAQLGLYPSQVTQECFFNIRRDSQTGKSKIVVQPMYPGLRKLARQTPGIRDAWAEVVYQGDDFQIFYAPERTIHHKSDPYKEHVNDDILGAYGVVEFQDGYRFFRWLNRSDLLRHRKYSDGYRKAIENAGKYNSAVRHPWDDKNPGFPGMCQKTALLAVLKDIEKTPVLQRAVDLGFRSDSLDDDSQPAEPPEPIDIKAVTVMEPPAEAAPITPAEEIKERVINAVAESERGSTKSPRKSRKAPIPAPEPERPAAVNVEPAAPPPEDKLNKFQATDDDIPF